MMLGAEQDFIARKNRHLTCRLWLRCDMATKERSAWNALLFPKEHNSFEIVFLMFQKWRKLPSGLDNG